MKKIIAIILCAVFVTSGSIVNAETLHEYFPGGKNYINIENVTVNGNVMELTENVVVKPNTTYTLSFPEIDYLGEIQYLYIYGTQDYLEDYPYDNLDCVFNSDYDYCTFTTSPEETHLNFLIQAADLGVYFDYYDVELFQLEEGLIQTDYEEYIVPYIDSDSPLFSGSGGFITSYIEVTTLNDIISSHIMAIDEVDGDMSDSIVVESDEYTGNEQTIGEYNCELSVTDNSGNKALFQLTIIVKDEIAPVITSDDDIYLNVNDGVVLSELFGDHIEYNDDYDLFPIVTILNDQFSGNDEVVGIYVVEFKVTDSSGNQTNKQVHIHVVDYEKPIITSNLSYQTKVDEGAFLSSMLDDIVTSDNCDLNPTVTIIEDNYTSNERTIGLYSVTIAVTDFSGNENQYVLSITVYDNDNPTLIGPSTISFSYTQEKTINDLKSLFTVNDNYNQLDISDVVIVNDTYSNRESKIGVYLITFEVSDESGNKVQKDLTITLYDDVVPVIFIDEHIIIIEKGSTFDENDALLLLRSNEVIDDREYVVNILINEYEGKEDIPGEYQYKIELVDTNGSVITKNFVIKVDDAKTDKPNYIRYGAVSGFILLFSGFIYVKVKK